MRFSDFQQQVNEARGNSETSRIDLKKSRQKVRNNKRQEEQILREIPKDQQAKNKRLKDIREKGEQYSASVNTNKTNFKNTLKLEWETLTEYLDITDPVENIESLPDDWPILLFPLRLETRFKKVNVDGVPKDQLWVRVFPDDIAINSFESDLSETEIRNAKSYWLSRWKAGKEIDGNRAAWRSLASAHGPGRAYWLISEDHYAPLNKDEEPKLEEGELILAIGTDEPLLDPDISSITTYWEEVWRAHKDNTGLSQAWEKLVDEVGEEKAELLVKDYKPANLNDPPPVDKTRENAVVRVLFVYFSKTEVIETKLHAWSQPPTTSILPERFTFMAYYQGVQEIKPQLGNLVPPELILGPDPAAEEGEDFRLASKEDADADPTITEGDLIYSNNMHWMFDFDEAIKKGMGFKIDLTPEQATRGFDKVFVLGMKLSANKDTGQVLLQDLFEHHQFSRKGMSILNQGTPTNNTEDDSSGYSWQHDPDDSFDHYFLSEFVEAEDEPETEQKPSTWFDKSDGEWLADMLGINVNSVEFLTNYSSKDISEALAMQQALWPATMGHFMDSLMNPVFNDQDIEQTRLFFTNLVAGRGFIPAIRVGKQPYGILPANNYTNMSWFSQHSDNDDSTHDFAVFNRSNNYLDRLYTILMDIDDKWTQSLANVSHVGKQGDAHQLLLDVVGLHPDSVELHKRYANTIKQIHNYYNMQLYNHEALFNTLPIFYETPTSLLVKFGYAIGDKNPAPELFNLSFFENSYLLKGAIIDTAPNSESELIRAYTSDGRNYIRWLIDAAEESHDKLRQQNDFDEAKPPSALLYLLLHHALDLSYIDTSLKLHLTKGLMNAEAVKKAHVEPDFIHIEQDNETESHWKYLYKVDERITQDPELLLGTYIAQNIHDLDEAAAFRDVLSGLSKLENVPTAKLERVLMEHIDTVSYRYDAWVLGYINLQLAYMRGLSFGSTTNSVNTSVATEAELKEKKGIYIGAYGWLEDLRPENKVLTPVELPEELDKIFNKDKDLVEDNTNAGYILAPSQNHAVTAAVLRNGHLSNEDPEDKEELKIKLTSDRVRLALQIIEGIQACQSLSALLGYQFERGLHDRTDAEVDQYIFKIRSAFPLVAKKIEETATDEDDNDIESIAQIEARNVIDGVAFLEHIDTSGKNEYPFGLDKAPFNLTMPSAPQADRDAINNEVRKLIETNDAVADLALAESVHQVVLGNYESANATLDTYSKGNFPPAPDVIKTPRSGTTLTHRVAIHLKTGISHSLADAGVTPRMVAEPALQHWLEESMPAVANIECVASYKKRADNSDQTVAINMSEIGMQAIDILYLLNVESDQAMTALDDLVMHHIISSADSRLDQPVDIEYTRVLNEGKFSVFEVSSLVASMRELLLKSKALSPVDAKISNEAAKDNEQALELDDARILQVVNILDTYRSAADPSSLESFRAGLQALIDADILDDIVNELDNIMSTISGLFLQISRYGMPQTGVGFVYQWQQTMLVQIDTKLDDLIQRWQNNKSDCETLLQEYTDGVADSLEDIALFAFLAKADLKVSASSTRHTHTTHQDYFNEISTVKLVQFNNYLNDNISPISSQQTLTPKLSGINGMNPQITTFDIIGIDISEQLKQVKIFAQDLLTGAENLLADIISRTVTATDLLNSAATSGDALTSIDFKKKAAQAILGEDFVIVPQFTLGDLHAAEWQNTITDSQNSLRYLLNEKATDFPMDDWLYGISRVREKLNHVENTLFHIEGFTGETLNLLPSQFPYRENDYWLGLHYPETIPNPEQPGEEIAFSIDEDKLLFTSIYTNSHSFDPLAQQCGLLIDEWTEVIPSRDETPGLAFHYDQPNSEPPQTLLLVTPSDFTGAWQWDDVVNTLHETLDMAKKRAVEPDHVDDTVYSLFLPAILSLTSPLPLTATLNLALNNLVSYAQVINDE